MICYDEDTDTFYLRDGTPEERADLDSKLTPDGQGRWLPRGQRGLGDLVKGLIDRAGDALGVKIPECVGCKRRQELLNKIGFLRRK